MTLWHFTNMLIIIIIIIIKSPYSNIHLTVLLFAIITSSVGNKYAVLINFSDSENKFNMPKLDNLTFKQHLN